MQPEERSRVAAPERLTCIACKSSGPFTPALEILLRCPQCGLVFADPQLSEEDVVRLYGASYFRGEEYADYLGDKTAIQRSFRPKIDFMAKVAPGLRRVFEIGAAYGYFLELAQERWEVAGIDVAEEPVAHGRQSIGLDLRHGDFLTAPIPVGYYDAFCLWDTIEHLARPDLYIERAAQLVAPGGFVFISTGDIESSVARRQGRSWRLIHPPTHLFYFSRQTLGRLLARHGFEVRSVAALGMHRSLRQTVYSLLVQRHPRLRPFYERFAATPIGALSYYLNLGDIMDIAAQAPRDPSTATSGWQRT